VSIKIHGIDFTSVPGPKKAITWVQCRLDEDGLFLESFESLTSFDAFENFLQQPGPWAAGMDFPFGQPRKLIENVGWPQTWAGYVGLVGTLTKTEFFDLLAKYRDGRKPGDKQHLRLTDKLAKSRSPMMLYRVPVGKMFFEGAPRLLKTGVNIRPCCVRDDPRLVLEAYPALVARRWIGNRSYKSDTRKEQTSARLSAREEIIRGLRSEDARTYFGFDIHFSDEQAEALVRDGTGDALDALLCAVQAGWAYSQRDRNFGIPTNCDPLEGWIVDPTLVR
jgi:hypothetical protein